VEGAGIPKTFAEICREVRGHGWRRVILLGEDLRDGPYSLKACLAQAGVLVLSPGAADRDWLRGIAAGGAADDAARSRFCAMLADGMEHGVNGLVVTDPTMLALVRTCANDAPIFDVTEV
jgi:hypothetical protein